MLLIRSWYFVICGLYVVDILLLICCWYVVCILLICGWYVVDMLLVCGWYVSGMWLICCRHVVGMLFTKQTNHKPSRESGPSRPVPSSTTSWCGLGWTRTGYQDTRDVSPHQRHHWLRRTCGSFVLCWATSEWSIRARWWAVQHQPICIRRGL